MLRQQIANIEARQQATRQYQQTIAEWQTRTLAQFIAATIPIEKGKENPVAKAASEIKLGFESDDLESTQKDDLPIEYYIEHGAPVQNKPGSYERLMGGFKPRS